MTGKSSDLQAPANPFDQYLITNVKIGDEEWDRWEGGISVSPPTKARPAWEIHLAEEDVVIFAANVPIVITGRSLPEVSANEEMPEEE